MPAILSDSIISQTDHEQLTWIDLKSSYLKHTECPLVLAILSDTIIGMSKHEQLT